MANRLFAQARCFRLMVRARRLAMLMAQARGDGQRRFTPCAGGAMPGPPKVTVTGKDEFFAAALRAAKT